VIRCIRLLAAVLLALPAFAQTTTTRAELLRNNTSACEEGSTAAHCQGGFSGLTDGNGETFDAAPGNVSRVDVHSLLYAGNATKVFVHVMPWWCMQPGSTSTGTGTACQSHIQIGYSSNNSVTVAAQVDDMLRRGLDGLVVSYYGRLNFYDQTTLKFRDELEKRCVGSWCPMQYALLEEQGSFQWTKCPIDGNGVDRTQCIIDAINSDLDYMDANYFNTNSYLKVDPATKLPSTSGRPAILFFICEECFVDPAPNWHQIWGQVRGHAQGLARGNGLFIFRNAPGFTHDESDGAFAWVNWYGADPYGLNYLTDFYNTSVLTGNANKLTWGGGWKGFNDSAASWAPSPPRRMDQQCGKTWLQTLKAADGKYNSSQQLPFMSLITWNDYEEGTEIETGIDNCLSLSAAVSGDILSWTLTFSRPTGSEETVHHYDVYDSADGENLTLKATLSPGSHSVDLRTLNLGPGTHKLYVHGVGMPSILNQLSNVATYNLTAAITVTPTALNYSPTLVGTSSATQSVTISNTGNTAVAIQSITMAGEFLQANNCPASLSAQASCQVQLSFKPSGANTRSGSLSILTSLSSTPTKVTLSGIGTYVKLTPLSLAFASRSVGSTSPSQNVTFTNTRSSALKITAISISSNFLQDNNCGTQVGAKASCTLNVRFRPASKGTKAGTLSISHDGGASPSKVSLSGTGR
jgi:hypothetical protein